MCLRCRAHFFSVVPWTSVCMSFFSRILLSLFSCLWMLSVWLVHCSENLNEMLGDLFLPCDTPEAPKQGFFKNLFGGGTSNLDREELCESHTNSPWQNLVWTPHYPLPPILTCVFLITVTFIIRISSWKIRRLTVVDCLPTTHVKSFI